MCKPPQNQYSTHKVAVSSHSDMKKTQMRRVCCYTPHLLGKCQQSLQT
jgi:hypothetical protein